MSQGAGDYIRSIGAAVEKFVTDDMRKLAAELVFPALSSECNKVRRGSRPLFQFETERDGKEAR